MTVSSIVPVNNYTGNSSTTKFDFDFLIEDENELVVQYTDEDNVTAILTLGVDYSINETGNEDGSYIIFPLDSSSYDVLKEDEKISLMLSLTIKQESEFENSSYFNFTVLEWTFDYIVRILQILSRKIDRCVKVDEGSDELPDEIIEKINLYKLSAENSASAAEEYEEQITLIKSDVEELIAAFNTTYDECYQSITSFGMENKADIDLSNLSEAGQAVIDNKADIDLSNLSETGQNVLDNKADIDLTNAEPSSEFKAASVQWGLPDYTAGVSISAEYTVPQPGFIICYINGSSGSRKVYINDALAVSTTANGSYYDSGSCSFPVDTDDVVTASTYSSPVFITYYPLKGV